ncbi:MAG: hypothetical protein JNM63_11805 [Spirochaetia bacterium]|nr:hypothetical protein [Spirochaetia bacterium]
MRLLVTGAGVIYSLPAVRRLGRLGHRLTVASSHVRANGFYSRFTERRFLYPPIAEEPEAFLNSLETFLSENPHDFGLPLFEETLILAKHRDRFKNLCRFPFGSYEDLLRFHDKSRFYRFATGLGLSIPRTLEYSGGAVPKDFHFPALLKVPQSSGTRGVVRVDAEIELAQVWTAMKARHVVPEKVSPLLQEWVDGEPYCALAYAWEGRPKGILIYRNLGQYPVEGGIGMIRESVEHPEIRRIVERLLVSSAWHGVVGFDFLVPRENAIPQLIDANPRLTPAVTLATRAGFDVLSMMTSFSEPEPAGKLRTGLRCFSEPVALRWVKELLPGGALGLGDFFRMIGPILSSRSETWDWGDAPSLRAIPAIFYDLFRSAMGWDVKGVDRIRSYQFSDYGEMIPRLSVKAPNLSDLSAHCPVAQTGVGKA